MFRFIKILSISCFIILHPDECFNPLIDCRGDLLLAPTAAILPNFQPSKLIRAGTHPTFRRMPSLIKSLSRFHIVLPIYRIRYIKI